MVNTNINQSIADVLTSIGVTDSEQQSRVLAVLDKERAEFLSGLAQLQDSIVTTVNDASRLTGTEGSVEERLAYVLEMTQSAANTTMDEIDALTQLTDDAKVHKHAQNILVAQGYQDLCGQFLNQIIQLINQLHGGLNKLAETAEQSGVATIQLDTDQPSNTGASAEGPQLKSASANRVAHNQDDVDDLLSDLGL